MTYTLTLHTANIVRTSWWKDENRKEPAGVWWLTGGGLSRPATDVEIELWKNSTDIDEIKNKWTDLIAELQNDSKLQDQKP